MNTRETLEAARDYIRPRARWQPRFGLNPDGPTCAGGALKWALSGYPCGGPLAWGRMEAHPAGRALQRQIVGKGGMTIGQFNDTHTHAEVLELFNLAIADEIAREEADFKKRLESSMERHSEALELLAT